MLTIEHAGDHFAWAYEPVRGYGYFLRTGPAEHWASALITGDDCVRVRRDFNRLKSKTSGRRYPPAAPSFAEVFDSIAGEYLPG